MFAVEVVTTVMIADLRVGGKRKVAYNSQIDEVPGSSECIESDSVRLVVGDDVQLIETIFSAGLHRLIANMASHKPHLISSSHCLALFFYATTSSCHGEQVAQSPAK